MIVLVLPLSAVLAANWREHLGCRCCERL